MPVRVILSDSLRTLLQGTLLNPTALLLALLEGTLLEGSISPMVPPNTNAHLILRAFDFEESGLWSFDS